MNNDKASLIGLTIQEVAKHAGLSAHTLRYYEKIGLIAPISRSTSRQRIYAQADLAWVEFLVRLRATHMPIRRMQEFAKLRAQGETTIVQRQALLELHLAELTRDIEMMQAGAEEIRKKVAYYREQRAG